MSDRHHHHPGPLSLAGFHLYTVPVLFPSRSISMYHDIPAASTRLCLFFSCVTQTLTQIFHIDADSPAHTPFHHTFFRDSNCSCLLSTRSATFTRSRKSCWRSPRSRPSLKARLRRAGGEQFTICHHHASYTPKSIVLSPSSPCAQSWVSQTTLPSTSTACSTCGSWMPTQPRMEWRTPSLRFRSWHRRQCVRNSVRNPYRHRNAVTF